jgi:hypothetical protein
MNVFDKFCAVLAFAFGVVFLILGALGLVMGTYAYIRLPPIAGVIPAFIGWGIVRAVFVSWGAKKEPPMVSGAAVDQVPSRLHDD